MANTSLRMVVQEDCKDILLWRNDPVTRQMSLSSDVINEEEHFKWFSKMLLDEDHCAIIGENKAKKFGVVFFLEQSGEVLVSINLAPEFRGKGLSSRLLSKSIQWYLRSRREIKYFTAKIKDGNHGSIRIFTQNGFELVSKVDQLFTYRLTVRTMENLRNV